MFTRAARPLSACCAGATLRAPVYNSATLRTRHTRHTTSIWIAALAILLAALAPAVSHALGQARGQPAVAVCTAQGMRWVQDLPDNPAEQRDAGQLMAHCLYCTLHGPVLDLPPAPASLVLLPALAHAVPAAFLSAPHPLHAWRSAQPRAPPPAC